MRQRAGRLLDLSYANPSVEIDPRVRSALVCSASQLSASALQYSPYGGATTARRLVATSLRQRTGLEFEYRDVILTAGATAALSIVFSAAFGPHDEVLLLRPSWFDYPLYLRDRGVKYRFVALTAEKRLDLAALQGALSGATAGIVLSQPQSPTGVILSQSELRSLAEILADASTRRGRDIILVCDEAHRDTAWGGLAVPSPLKAYPHTVLIYSFGKGWRMQGQRIGYAAVSPRSPARRPLAAALVERSRAMGFGCPNTVMQEVATRLLSLEPDNAWLHEAQTFMRGLLAASGYEVVAAGATMFVYAQAPGGDDWRFVRELARRGVLALPSGLCHESGYFRLALNVARRDLEGAAPAFAEAAGAT